MILFWFEVVLLFERVKKQNNAVGRWLRKREKEIPAMSSAYALLSPIRLDEKEKACYSDEFNLALAHPDAKNIALSGPYGAGKSSVAITIEEAEVVKGRKWVHISLADFDGVSNERSVEDEILSQLVYKVPPKNLSKSRLKPLRDASRLRDAICAVLILLFVLDTTFLFCAANGGMMFSLPAVSEKTTVATAIAVWCALLGYAIYHEFRTKSASKTFKRLKILNAEVELFNGENDTALDKYMDDIVYVLKNSKLDVVVFEDIDRFDNLTVFEKLRRINDLANEGRPRTLRFLYLIKDSLFKEPHERTKFFDFIIPVIPFIDPSNSIGLLKRGLEAGGIKVGEAFLYQLSSFVDDPRILKEICNESIHYRRFLFTEEEIAKYESENLIGIVAYKVLFPEDYENLQRGRGYVQSLFSKKEKLVEKLIAQNRNKINRLQEKINRTRETLRLNESELQLLYLSTMKEFRCSRDYQYAEGDGSTEPSNFIESIRNNQNLDLDYKLEQIENSNTEYSSRLREIRGDFDAASAIYRRQINELEKRSAEYSRMRLSDLIAAGASEGDFFTVQLDDLVREADYKEFGIDEVMTSKYLPLIRFLVSQGWLDETYPRYMSNVYPDSIFPSDLDFVNSALGAGPSQPGYKIVNPEAVSIRLDRRVLLRSSSRNYSLLAGLLSLKKKELTEAMLEGVHQDRDSSFIAGFLSSDSFEQFVFHWLDESYSEWPIDMIENSMITDRQKIISLRRAFSASSLPTAISREAQAIGEFVSLYPDFPSGLISDPVQFAKSLDLVSYSPDDINVDACNEYVLGRVIELGLYVPEAPLVSKLFSWRYKRGELINLADLNVGVCRESDGAIRNRVLNDINCYVSSLVVDSQVSLRDDDEAIEMILGADGLSESACREYVNALANPICSLSRIESDEFACIAIELGKVKPTVANLLSGYGRLGFFDGLSEFIAGCGKIGAAAGDIADGETKTTARGLLESCLSSESLDADAIERVAGSFGCSFAGITLPAYEPQKIERLIDLHALKVTASNLTSIREVYPDLVSRFAKCDLKLYADLVCGVEGEGPQCELCVAEVVEIFEDEDADLSQKVRIAKVLEDQITLKPSFPDEVNICLIERNMYDCPESLILPYEHGGKSLRETVAKIIESKPCEFVEVDLPGTLEKRLLEGLSGESRVGRVDFVAQRIDALIGKNERERVRSILQEAGLVNYVKLIDGPLAMIESTSEDDRLLNLLTRLGMCGKVAIKTNRDGKRRVSSRGYCR